jgi:hypothetical protein
LEQRKPTDATNRTPPPPLPQELFGEIDQEPKIEFTTTAYAVLEREQKVEVIIKRTGPIDVDVQFRCLHSLSHIHLCMPTL